MICLNIAVLMASPRAPLFGFHAAEVAIRGDVLHNASKILRACGMVVTETRIVTKPSELEDSLQGADDVIVAYRYKGWTHFYDPSYALLAEKQVWHDLSRPKDRPVISWCAEETTSAYAFSLYRNGQALRVVNVNDGLVEANGKTLPEERGLKWSTVTAEEVLNLAKRLGAPMALDSSGTTYSILKVKDRRAASDKVADRT